VLNLTLRLPVNEITDLFLRSLFKLFTKRILGKFLLVFRSFYEIREVYTRVAKLARGYPKLLPILVNRYSDHYIEYSVFVVALI
jgi:hypothetical protein